MLGKALLTAATGMMAGGEALGVEDVFSTFLYTGNGSTQTITNGIDLAGEGGLVWIKNRNDTNGLNHFLYDTVRGANKQLVSNFSSGEGSASTGWVFNSDGFTQNNNFAALNLGGNTYASWTFRKAPKFFDVVTYTGNGSNRTIAHNLGSVPGCIIVKRTDTTAAWFVYHSGTGPFNALQLNTTDAAFGNNNYWNNTAPTSSVFSVGIDARCNASGGTYVAYLFAHDAGGFGDSGNESVIKCGSYTGNGSATGPVIDLGWEPQWVMIKRATGGASNPGWGIFDNMRGVATGGIDQLLAANLSDAEGTWSTVDWVDFLSTGFQPKTTSFNATSTDYIYIAIRRGPMKTPTDATKVFKADLTAASTTFSTGFDAVDSVVMKREDIAGAPWHWMSRLTNLEYLDSASTGAGVSYSAGAIKWDLSGSFYQNAVASPTQYLLRRAPGFFDVVCYTGTGSARTISHNLGVAPELIIIKQRNADNPWSVYYGDPTKYLKLNTTDAANTLSTYWNNTSPTSTVFTVGTKSDVNGSGSTLIAYLFASCPGVSKVGSYTGTGTALDIDCGFTNGARFVLIKRTDSSGGWFVWDAARGIVSGNDPYLLLNSSVAEVTSTDFLDPLPSGFSVPANGLSFGTFIFLAIA